MKDEKVKSRQEYLARIELVNSIEKKILGLKSGEMKSFNKIDALTITNVRTRITAIKKDLDILFETKVSGSNISITRI